MMDTNPDLDPAPAPSPAPGRFNPLDAPQCLELPGYVNAIAWHEHIPFGKALMELLRPSTFVELGVHTGDSYLALCEAAAALNLPIACFGVDTWTGDKHAGFYGHEILAELRLHHDPNYGKFSRLVQSTFDEAVGYFADSSIALLHIDGLHTYEAVKHDFETWLPKVSATTGVILFHDINVRENDFGVWRLWEEVRVRHRSFEFLHKHGLGVLAVGTQLPPAMDAFMDYANANPERIRNFFFALGNRVTLQAELERTIAAAREEARRLKEQSEAFDRLALARGREIEALQAALANQTRELQTCQAARAVSDREAVQLRESQAHILNGFSFRLGRAVTAPFRFLGGAKNS
jgi:hypothetical protein